METIYLCFASDTTFLTLGILGSIAMPFVLLGFLLSLRKLDPKAGIADYLYKTLPTEGEWRWRKIRQKNKFIAPKQEVTSSSIHFTPKADFASKSMAFMGYLWCVFMVIVLPIMLFVERGQHPDPPNWLQTLLIFWIAGFASSWVLLQLDRRVSKLELTKDALIVHVHYGLKLKRSIEYKKEHFVSAKGRMQTFLERNRHQEELFFRLKIRQKKSFRSLTDTTYIVNCNDEQGQWLVGGLHYWKYGKPEQADVKDSSS